MPPSTQDPDPIDRQRRRFLSPIQDFLGTEISGAVLVLVAAGVAIAWANLAPATYDSLWNRHLAIPFGSPSVLELSLRDWVSEVAMTLFFFVVGLEIKRELTAGELRDRRAVALPVVAALGGMVLPAALYLAMQSGSSGVPRGWGIPMATDIPFALAVLTVAGRGLPSRMRLFLLTLAITDDVGSILVIAVFYSGGIKVVWLCGAIAGVAAMVALQRVHLRWLWPYVVLGVGVWYATFRAGPHPAIAGVVLGLLAPAVALGRPHPNEETPLLWLEHRLHPWSSYVVVPLFALASAGVVLRPSALAAAITSPVFIGIMAGRLIGKTLGVYGTALVGTQLGLGNLPGSRMAMLGLAMVTGIGFTVALFVTQLALVGPDAQAAKVAILAAAVVAGGLGAWVLRRVRRVGA